jgi:hypothetical protein
MLNQEDEELKTLQDEQARKNTNIGYIDALNTIATSIAGKQSDMGAEQFRDQNAQKVRDYLLQKQQARKAVEDQQKDTMFNRQIGQMDAQGAESATQRDPTNPTAQIVHKLAVKAGIVPPDAAPMSLYDMKQAGIEPVKVLTDINAAKASFENAKAIKGMDYGQQEKMAGVGQANDMTKIDAQHGNQLELQGNDIASREKMAAIKPAPKPSGDQYKAAGFAARLRQAEGDFEKVVNDGYDRSDYSSSIAAGIIPESLSSEKWKMQTQAERNFVNAVLRRESGAAISPSEFSNAEQQYFPRAGDTPEVLKQKKANRELVMQSLTREAGDAMESGPARPAIDMTQFKRK